MVCAGCCTAFAAKNSKEAVLAMLGGNTKSLLWLACVFNVSFEQDVYRHDDSFSRDASEEPYQVLIVHDEIP